MLLRPSMLDDLGLAPALAWLLKEVARPSGFEMNSDIDPAVDTLPDVHRTCVYRLVQKTLTNVSRHAGAHRVEVSLKSAGGWVTGGIADDGRGFRAGRSEEHWAGTVGMEERVRELGGSIRVLNRPRERHPRPISLALPSAEAEVHIDTDSDRGRSRDRADRIEASA